ncbi:MAG TPA: hypothetical protein VL133_01100 [Devosia sp.]|nr:hypothetical protein [Devosia sp.]
MNTKLLLATAVALSLTGGVVMANEASPLLTSAVVAAVNPVNSESNLLLQRSDEAGTSSAIVKSGSALSRAQVRAQVATARANGTLLSSDADFDWVALSSPSSLTRSAVKANVAGAIANHALPRNDSEYVEASAIGHMDRARTL